MADRQDPDREVLTSLPRSRPVRRSAKRGDRADAKTAAASGQTRRPTAAKPRSGKGASAKAAPVRTAGADAERPPSTAPQPASDAAPGKAPQPTSEPAATAASDASANAAREAPPSSRATGGTPRAAPRRKVPPAGYAAPSARADDAAAADILSTVIQAAAELAEIGLTIGRQSLQSMLDRLPKP